MELLKSVVAWDLHPIHMENVQGALALLLHGSKGLRLVCSGEGFVSTALPDLEQGRAKGCSSPALQGSSDAPELVLELGGEAARLGR